MGGNGNVTEYVHSSSGAVEKVTELGGKTN